MGNFSENLESVEYYEMAEKERLIGKQICIVGMLCPDEVCLGCNSGNDRECIR